MILIDSGSDNQSNHKMKLYFLSSSFRFIFSSGNQIKSFTFIVLFSYQKRCSIVVLLCLSHYQQFQWTSFPFSLFVLRKIDFSILSTFPYDTRKTSTEHLRCIRNTMLRWAGEMARGSPISFRFFFFCLIVLSMFLMIMV